MSKEFTLSKASLAVLGPPAPTAAIKVPRRSVEHLLALILPRQTVRDG
jgi:hypothetical protein